MSWMPDAKEKKCVELLYVMCLDTLQGKGPEDKKSFLMTLKLVRKELKKINKPVDAVTAILEKK